jgi:hypothetical protein
MVQRLAKLASFSFSARSSSRMDADIPMTSGLWADLVLTSLAAIAIAFFITIAIGAASAQEHRHPQQDEQLHYKFYSTWMMPDNPKRSCCNKADCYPTEARFEDGRRVARMGNSYAFQPLRWSRIATRRMDAITCARRRPADISRRTPCSVSSRAPEFR